ncbi:MAG: hypothetical protein ABI091_16175 [Ferruginibacter sp.]
MRYAHVYALLLMFVFNTFCEGQNKTDLPRDNIKSETKDTVTSVSIKAFDSLTPSPPSPRMEFSGIVFFKI